MAADGSAYPKSTFSAATDTKIIVALTLDDQVMVCGSTISYVRILGTTGTPSLEYTLTRPLTQFYVEFDAGAGKTFTPGHYRLRFYANKTFDLETSYDVV